MYFIFLKSKKLILQKKAKKCTLFLDQRFFSGLAIRNVDIFFFYVPYNKDKTSYDVFDNTVVF